LLALHPTLQHCAWTACSVGVCNWWYLQDLYVSTSRLVALLEQKRGPVFSRVQVAESRFLNNKLVEVVGFMENISRECNAMRRV
jgi:hypothetical protein